MKEVSHGYDIIGNIAIVKFSAKTKSSEKKKFAEDFLKKSKSIKTILEKVGKFKGKLRKQKTKYILGEKTKEALHRENGCIFRLNVDETYFSPRLGNERKEIASKIKKGEDILVMFSGVGPFSIVIAKNSKAKKVTSVEINKKANEYAEQNVELNKLKDKVELIQGNIKKIYKKIPKFDVIVMPRPKLKETFLKEAFSLSKKGTRIFYYDFCKEDEIEKLKGKIKNEAKKSGKKIKILNVKKAGEIGVYKFRMRIDLLVL
ncbi:methyltransferase domain-containing protein [Candidatus Pacearchaeota archaeon]|nr:methyltransferase domain-containing protein [Candidatus Pacearchaeota archaeon]